MDTDENESESSSRKLMLFGRDLAAIPCFRSSWLYGISSGLGTGLVCFLGTSSPRKAYNYGFTASMAVTFTYWCFCRYNYQRQVEELQKMKEYVEKRVLMDGTEMEKLYEASEIDDEKVSV